ncbi:CLUMA_CG006824, isoform A [Clunio marinus]|uniref:CLUMA_CG006824, isoform A n=1 Tax=Clunio marinus TaxID=568069 RepID=A0A1J1HYV0_9DIPT|nr:CLUMA_CG006824, isoform A [Clunio marinus]
MVRLEGASCAMIVKLNTTKIFISSHCTKEDLSDPFSQNKSRPFSDESVVSKEMNKTMESPTMKEICDEQDESSRKKGEPTTVTR